MLDYLRIMLNARLAKMDERGASAVEYGLLIAGIAALIVVVVFAFGGVISNDLPAPRAQRRWPETPAPTATADPSITTAAAVPWARGRCRAGPSKQHGQWGGQSGASGPGTTAGRPSPSRPPAPGRTPGPHHPSRASR